MYIRIYVYIYTCIYIYAYIHTCTHTHTHTSTPSPHATWSHHDPIIHATIHLAVTILAAGLRGANTGASKTETHEAPHHAHHMHKAGHAQCVQHAAPNTETAAPNTAAPNTETAAPNTETAAPHTYTAAPHTYTAAPNTYTAAPNTETAHALARLRYAHSPTCPPACVQTGASACARVRVCARVGGRKQPGRRPL